MYSENMDKILELVKLCMKNGIEFNLQRDGNLNEGIYIPNEKKYILNLPNENDFYLKNFIDKKVLELEEFLK